MILMIGVGLSSCKKESADPSYVASVAAKGYYDLLLQGKCEDFVAGYNCPNRLPDSYQKQLLLNTQMFLEQQQTEHKGMSEVKVLNAKADTSGHVADVFLQVSYGDSTKEQISVPMVEVGGKWKMR